MCREMDVGMEDSVEDYSDVSSEGMENFEEYLDVASEVDFDYEYDAAQFFDFTRPETLSEAAEAERWFESARGYSSPRPKIHKGMNQACLKLKTKLKEKSSIKSSTLMKPTASHLAKLKQPSEVLSSQLLRRSQKQLNKVDERILSNLLGVDSDSTKRQKLESGYLRKVAHLKHQSLMLHKSPKIGRVDVTTVISKWKATIPREPDLETAHRAERHRFRNNSESSEHEKSKAPSSIAHPLNRKILKIPSLLPLKKTRPREFHLRTSQRAMQHSSANAAKIWNFESFSSETSETERLDFEGACKQEKCITTRTIRTNKNVFSKKDVGTSKNVKQESKEHKLSNDDKLSYDPPTELFSKLSLQYECKREYISQPKQSKYTKGSEENVPHFIKQDLQVEEAQPVRERMGTPWKTPTKLQQEHGHPLRYPVS